MNLCDLLKKLKDGSERRKLEAFERLRKQFKETQGEEVTVSKSDLGYALEEILFR